MDITIYPRKLAGEVCVIPSKSQAHRLLICAAFADNSTTIICRDTNQDIEATAECLRALGAKIERTTEGYIVHPAKDIPKTAELHCHESGSTLRFMLPVVGALGVDGIFVLEGRLPQRPLSPLWEEMERMGCSLGRPAENTLRCSGSLRPGNYSIDGGVSSQFITGLLFAMAIIGQNSQLTITGKVESKPYILMTQQALSAFGVNSENYKITSGQKLRSPGTLTVEGDWSNGAFWLAANALGSKLKVEGLDKSSAQGDRAVADILSNIDIFAKVDAADIPDLVPILSVAGGANNGICFTNIARLRLKESDRVETVTKMMAALGVSANSTDNELSISCAPYNGCTIDAAGDHRIAMSAAIAATVANAPVTIIGAQCVAKSYPTFWEEYKKLGGHYEQHVR